MPEDDKTRQGSKAAKASQSSDAGSNPPDPAGPKSEPSSTASTDPTPQEAPEAAQEEGTFRDDQYTAAQLIANADETLGQESYLVETALRQAGAQDYFTLDEARELVDGLLSHEPEEA